MKTFSLLILSLLLGGCTTVTPLAQQFPDAPALISEPCAQLTLLNDPTTLSELTKTIADNYAKYHTCSAIVDAWIEWHTQQKENFNLLRKN